jgi:hypothetical protein
MTDVEGVEPIGSAVFAPVSTPEPTSLALLGGALALFFLYGVAAVEGGTQYPVIGAGGEADGFRRTAHRAITMAGGVPIVAGIMPMVGEGRYGPEDDWGALWYPYRGWRGPREAGVIHSQSQTGLTPSYLLRVRLRVLAISFAQGALR